MNANEVSSLLYPYRGNSSNYGDPATPLADHLPMTLTALLAMGATKERAAQWARSYSARLGLRPTSEIERNGRRKWRERIGRDGASATLQHAARTLADGMGAAAFHSIIRAAYALARGDEDDLAAAFESWEREYVDLPTPSTVVHVDVRYALAALQRSCVLRPTVGKLIAIRMGIVGADAAFAPVASMVPRARDIDELAIAAATAFYLSSDFTALHVMTATHAFRFIASHLLDTDSIMPAFWRAYAAAAIVSGAIPRLDASLVCAIPGAMPTEWEAMLARAVDDEDEHVIKATYTAWQLDLAIGNPIFHAAAHAYIHKRTAKQN